MPASAYGRLHDVLGSIDGTSSRVTIVSTWKHPLLALRPLGYPVALAVSHSKGRTPLECLERGVQGWMDAQERQQALARETALEAPPQPDPCPCLLTPHPCTLRL